MSLYSKPKAQRNSTPAKPAHNPDTRTLAQRWAEGKADDFTVHKRAGRPSSKKK